MERNEYHRRRLTKLTFYRFFAQPSSHEVCSPTCSACWPLEELFFHFAFFATEYLCPEGPTRAASSQHVKFPTCQVSTCQVARKWASGNLHGSRAFFTASLLIPGISSHMSGRLHGAVSPPPPGNLLNRCFFQTTMHHLTLPSYLRRAYA